MKRILVILIPLAAIAGLIVLPACKKTNEYPSKVVTLSFPIVTLNGAQDTTINRGAPWVDPGASWIDTVTGESGLLKVSVNTSVDSAYLLVYTATNKNGFKTSVTRGLGVTNYNGPKNISGPYTDNAGNYDSLYLVSRALYYHPNIDLYGDNGVVVIKSDSTISVSTIYTLITGTTGAPLQTLFSQASINYTAPITFGYNVTILNVPTYGASFTHN